MWSTLSHISRESLTLPRREFDQELCSAVHERDHAAFLRMLASKPELALYKRIHEDSGFRVYLQRDTRGQQAAQLRLQLRSGTSILRHHDSRIGTSPAMTQRTASAQFAERRTAQSLYTMCCCIALHMCGAGHPCACRLLIYQQHRAVH